MLNQLGKYEIIRTLGQGAMGEVYLAHHPTIGRDVAIKTILPTAAKGEDAEDRFRREATAAGKLNHPNVVTIFDFDKEGDLLYLVMEYVKGEDLEDIISQQSMTQSQFLEVLAQICDGLAYAHRNGIIHRDIKPANVRVIRDGKRILAKVMDFGIARTQDSNMTATGIVMGTVSYMAPEYIQTGRSTTLGDLWAVGVMLYECLSSRKPFGGDNTTTILFKIVSEMPPPIDPDDIQGISPSVRYILDRALSKDPNQRFQTAEEFAKALRACKDPSWKGTLEATAVMGAMPGPQSQATVVLPGASVAMPAPSAPTVAMPPQAMPVPGMAPTAMMPAQLNPMAPTVMMPSPGYPQQVPPTGMMPMPGYPQTAMMPMPQAPPQKTGSKVGLYALAGVGLLAIGGTGAYFMFGRKSAEPAAASAPAASPAAAPAAAPQTPASTTAQTASQPANTPPAVPKETGKAATQPAASAPMGQAPQAAPAAPKPEPPKPVEETPAQKLAKAVPLIGTDPGQAAGILRGLAASQAADAAVQGNFLAALYRTRNAAEFERVLDSVKASGLSGPQLMKAAPAFRQAMVDELSAQKAKNGTNVLSLALVNKVVQ